MFTVHAVDLENWSKTYPAKAELPRWIARLIWASCTGLRHLDMPGGEHVHLAGFDGIVDSDGGDDMVPDGRSAWELSVDADVKGKADDDYEKRTTNPGHLTKSDVAFVFATPRKWGGATAWVQGKSSSDWREVRVLYSSHLERWFERVPWVAAAFLQTMLGKGQAGLESVEMVWTTYENVPAAAKLDADFIIGGRTGIARDFIGWLTAAGPRANRVIRVAGPSVREVLHFLIAVIRQQPDNARPPLESRVFAVHTEDAARLLRGVGPSHVIFVTPGKAVPYVLRLSESVGCGVVLVDSTPPDAPAQPAPTIPVLHLENLSEAILVKSLIRVGYAVTDAIAICKSCECDYDRLRTQAFMC